MWAGHAEWTKLRTVAGPGLAAGRHRGADRGDQRRGDGSRPMPGRYRVPGRHHQAQSHRCRVRPGSRGHPGRAGHERRVQQRHDPDYLVAMPRRSAVLAAKAVIVGGLVLAAGTIAVGGSLLAGRTSAARPRVHRRARFPAAVPGARADAARAAAGSVLYLVPTALLSLGHRHQAVRGLEAVARGPCSACCTSSRSSPPRSPTRNWQQHLEQIGPMSASTFAIQATTGLSRSSHRPAGGPRRARRLGRRGAPRGRLLLRARRLELPLPGSGSRDSARPGRGFYGCRRGQAGLAHEGLGGLGMPGTTIRHHRWPRGWTGSALHLRRALDEAPAGPVRLVSLCAGQGHDVIGTLPGHARCRDVSAVLIEHGERNVAEARRRAEAAGLPEVTVRRADASRASQFAPTCCLALTCCCSAASSAISAPPTSSAAWQRRPRLQAAGATRHLDPPPPGVLDLTPDVRAWFTAGGFDEVARSTLSRPARSSASG